MEVTSWLEKQYVTCMRDFVGITKPATWPGSDMLSPEEMAFLTRQDIVCIGMEVTDTPPG